MKSERGITLMVLAITIAVMSILAFVSFRQLIGNNSEPMKEMKNEIKNQQKMVENEKGKINNEIESLEEEWGL